MPPKTHFPFFPLTETSFWLDHGHPNQRLPFPALPVVRCGRTIKFWPMRFRIIRRGKKRNKGRLGVIVKIAASNSYSAFTMSQGAF